MSILNTSGTAIRTYAMPANAAEVVAEAAKLYGSEYYQYVDSKPFIVQALIEAWQRDSFHATMADGSVKTYDILHEEYYAPQYRDPNHDAFLAFLKSDDFQNCTTLIGTSRGGREVILRRESQGWSVWLRRKYATYELKSVYQLPWRDVEYASETNEAGENIRELVTATAAAYEQISLVEYKSQQVAELSEAIFKAVSVLIPINETIKEWPNGVNFHQPWITVHVPDHDQIPSIMTLAVSCQGDQWVEINSNHEWGWIDSYRVIAAESFEDISMIIIEKDLEIAIANRQRQEESINPVAHPPRPPREVVLAAREAARLEAGEV